MKKNEQKRLIVRAIIAKCIVAILTSEQAYVQEYV